MSVEGYLYIAYGDEHVNEALSSVKSLKAVDVNAHVTIITDQHVDGFDRVVKREKIRRGFSGKVDNLSNEYYERTMYVDTDTYFCEDCSGLFKLLDYFDLCAVLDPAEVDVLIPGLTSFNTGVLLYNNGIEVTKFLKRFRDYYNDHDLLRKVLKNHPAERVDTDQPLFTEALKDSNVKVYPLPDIWNARYRFNISLMGRVKIIHGPSIDFESLREKMNATTGNRIWKGLR